MSCSRRLIVLMTTEEENIRTITLRLSLCPGIRPVCWLKDQPTEPASNEVTKLQLDSSTAHHFCPREGHEGDQNISLL